MFAIRRKKDAHCGYMDCCLCVIQLAERRPGILVCGGLILLTHALYRTQRRSAPVPLGENGQSVRVPGQAMTQGCSRLARRRSDT